MLLDRILVTEKTTRTPRVHLVRCSMNKSCDITNVVLSGNIINYVHKTKYLGVLLCIDMKHLLMYVAKQVSFMHKPIYYYVTFVTVQMM